MIIYLSSKYYYFPKYFYYFVKYSDFSILILKFQMVKNILCINFLSVTWKCPIIVEVLEQLLINWLFSFSRVTKCLNIISSMTDSIAKVKRRQREVHFSSRLSPGVPDNYPRPGLWLLNAHITRFLL